MQLEAKTHSGVGASSAKRWLNCPGSVNLIAQIPTKETSKYAAEGTVAHGIAEHLLHNGVLHVLAKDHPLYGTIQEQDDYKIEVTVEMLEGADLYVKTIMGDMMLQNLLTYHPQDRFYSARPDVAPYLAVEKGFCLRSIDEELYGTNDASVCVPFGKLTVYDYKYGAGVAVNVEENEQLMFYALGVAEEAGGLENLCLQEIELVIIQPRANHNDGPIRRWSTTPERLRQFGNLLKEKLAEVRSKNPSFKSGSHCKFCNAKLICNESKNAVNAVAQMDFAPINYDAKLAPKYAAVTTPPNIVDLTPEAIANVLDKASMVKDWIAAVETHAMEQLKAGYEIPGFKLVQKKGNRAWADETTVITEFESLYGNEIFTERKLKSPAQLEKIVGKDCVKDHVIIPDAGFTVARESDKRQGVVPAISDFTPVMDI